MCGIYYNKESTTQHFLRFSLNPSAPLLDKVDRTLSRPSVNLNEPKHLSLNTEITPSKVASNEFQKEFVLVRRGDLQKLAPIGIMTGKLDLDPLLSSILKISSKKRSELNVVIANAASKLDAAEALHAVITKNEEGEDIIHIPILPEGPEIEAEIRLAIREILRDTPEVSPAVEEAIIGNQSLGRLGRCERDLLFVQENGKLYLETQFKPMEGRGGYTNALTLTPEYFALRYKKLAASKGITF
jgi:hypothetical protein